MLRLINIQEIDTNQVFPDWYIFRETFVTVDVVDVEKQETLGTLHFNYDWRCPNDLAHRLLRSKGEERTRLTTITGETEELIRKHFSGIYEPSEEDALNWIESVK